MDAREAKRLADSVFPGHANAYAETTHAPPGTRPKRLRNREARNTATTFLTHGRSTHSSSGSTLWVVSTLALRAGLHVSIEGNSVLGYVCVLLSPPPRP